MSPDETGVSTTLVESTRKVQALERHQSSRSGGDETTVIADEWSSSEMTNNKYNIGQIPLQFGEIIDDEFERPLSAPPPPGFGDLGPEQRNRLASELIWGTTGSSDEQQHHSADHGNTHLTDQRISSFTSLAAMLGTGLAESLEDAAHERHISSTANANGSPGTSPEDLLSYHRMTRHAASRLIGHSRHTNPNSASTANAIDSMFHVEASGNTTANNNNNNTTSNSDHRTAQSARGKIETSDFPSMFTSPSRNGMSTREKDQILRRATTPVQLYPGQEAQRRGPPPPKDIGMLVMEPEEEDLPAFKNVVSSQRLDRSQPVDSNSQYHHPGLQDLGVRSMWSPDAREFKPASFHPAAAVAYGGGGGGPPSQSSSVSNASEVSPRQAELELRPFLWGVDDLRRRASRTLAILHVLWVRAPDIRAACEGFGVIESFRSDFSSLGIYFVSFYDIRSAQYAALELQPILQRLSVMQRSSEEVVVAHCLSLSSSGQFDESQILISNLPMDVHEAALRALLSSYGALRSMINQNDGSVLVEFHNIQDCKQALLEIESSHPWGPGVLVEVPLRNPAERQKGRELLSLIGRWRHGMRQPPTDTHLRPCTGGPSPDPWSQASAPATSIRQSSQSHYLMGSDVRHSQIINQNTNPMSQTNYGHSAGFVDNPQPQQFIQGPDGQIYAVTSVSQHVQPQTSNLYHSQPLVVTGSSPYVSNAQTPFYTHIVTSDAGSLSGRSHRSGHSIGTEDRDNRLLRLNLDAVESGEDQRTSLMVRNIPNKYTQQMLLSEFEENGLGPGVIDFFYLPIDFKNRCNRGYAFVNFVNYADILTFHRQYFGKHWRTFNSDKICDITYARIQGKAAMLKRFENSALMEKDEEYKPLVFVSDGPDKGKRLPFPDPSSKARAQI
jgi:RNA recognition motif-containing protein